MAKAPQNTKTRPRRDAEHTRKALMECALDMYQRFGYESTNLRKIGQEVQVSGPAMYYHFSSKSELLSKAFHTRMEQMIIAHESLPEGLTNIERLWTFTALHLRLQFGTQSRPMTGAYVFGTMQLLVLCEAEHSEQLRKLMRIFLDRLSGIILQGIDEGVFLRVHPVATANAIFGMSNQASAWFQMNGPLTLPELSALYARFSLRMLGVSAVENEKYLLELVENAVLVEGLN